MIAIQQEPPVTVAGTTLIAITRTALAGECGHGAYLFAGAKHTLAIICRGPRGDAIFAADGEALDTDQLQALLDTA